MRHGKLSGGKRRNGAGCDDPDRLPAREWAGKAGGGAKAERARLEVRRFAEGLGQERRPCCGRPKKLVATGERKAGLRRGSQPLISLRPGFEALISVKPKGSSEGALRIPDGESGCHVLTELAGGEQAASWVTWNHFFWVSVTLHPALRFRKANNARP